MNKNFSDDQLDQILEKIVKDSLLNEDVINEIADSPHLRWNVQSRIKQEKSVREKSWFPLWNWKFAAFASLAFVIFAGLISFVNFKENDSIAEIKKVDSQVLETAKNNEAEIKPEPKIEYLPEIKTNNKVPKISPKKTVSTKTKLKTNILAKMQKTGVQPKKPAENLAKNEKIKTEFIALSYSPAPESGQILKVKVPRSMMISLGVAANIENGSQLVNAEVLMGDDGLARAIRFVQ